MSIDLSKLPQQLTLATGERIVIPLPSYADSGNNWSASCLYGHGIAEVSIVLCKTTLRSDAPGDGSAEPPPLMLVPEQVVVSGLAVGEALWQLVLSRSFGSTRVAASRNLQITVHALR